jgi:rare lipoprotein A
VGIHLINTEEKNDLMLSDSGAVMGLNSSNVSSNGPSRKGRFTAKMQTTAERASRWPRSIVSLGIAGIAIAGSAAIVHAHREQPPTPSLQPVTAPVIAKKVTPVKSLHKAITSPLRGIASWYGLVLHGHTTASGEVFDETKMTACHNSLPFGTRVRVTDVNSKKSVVVRINDRGVLFPGRVIDLSSAAAERLGILRAGVANVKLEVLKKTPDDDIDAE